MISYVHKAHKMYSIVHQPLAPTVVCPIPKVSKEVKSMYSIIMRSLRSQPSSSRLCSLENAKELLSFLKLNQSISRAPRGKLHIIKL